jgi:cyclophilin family peptidyl-prolyl cis-trans isomerase
MMTRVLIIAATAVIVGGGVWYLTTLAPAGAPSAAAVAQATDQSQASTTAVVAAATTTTNPTPMPTNITEAVLHTNLGDITFTFLPQAPATVANFIKLASSGLYDSTKFHRVIKGFMDQGGDPLTKDDSMMARWGTGGPGYQFADENASAHNGVGVVAMANSGPNTNGSQFFINAADNGFLDGKYSVFAKVTSGLDVAMAINNTPTDSSDRPLKPVVLESITLK